MHTGIVSSEADGNSAGADAHSCTERERRIIVHRDPTGARSPVENRRTHMLNGIRQSIRWLFVAIIRVYQAILSPVLPASCRFYPSCSDYAVESIERFGAIRGMIMAIRRISRCHPWNEGGFDPVPTRSERE